MSLSFKSLCSSSGNCVALWSDNTRVIIDCGFGSMKRCRAALTAHLSHPVENETVLLSHVHGDHISYYPLRALENMKMQVWIHSENIALLEKKHFRDYGFRNLDLRTFGDEPFRIGDFCIASVEVQHNPAYPTHGFVIKCHDSGRDYKVVVVTDFCQWKDIADIFTDADFIFVESNYDYDLLEKYYNPNSLYHMPNPETANLLCHVRKNSSRFPGKVMLGHISSQRNRGRIAIAETRKAFKKQGLDLDFELMAAPLEEASDVIVIA